MARAKVGGTADDFVYMMVAGGLMRAIANAVITYWSAKVGGVQYTDLLLDGVPVTTTTSDAYGQIPEAEMPDGVYEVWVSANGGPRIKLSPATSDARNAADITNPASATHGALSATYVPFAGAASYTYNADGTVATETVGGLVTTYTYNADQSVHTVTRNGVTLTYSYNADGTVSGVA